MAGENPLIEVALLSGTSDRPSLTFTPGTPAPAVSVGTAAQWTVKADGVNPTHLYLVFDGRSVHVASASPSFVATLGGAPIGTDWVLATVPCELRFGAARAMVRTAAPARASAPAPAAAPAPVAAPAAEPPLEERTMHDGGALWQAAQRAVQTAQATHGSPLGTATQIGPHDPSAMPREPLRPQAPDLPTRQSFAPLGATTVAVAPGPARTGGDLGATLAGKPTPARAPLNATTPLADAKEAREALNKALAGATPPHAERDSSPSTIRAPRAAGAAANAPELAATVAAPSPLGAPGGKRSVPPPVGTAAMPPGTAAMPPMEGRAAFQGTQPVGNTAPVAVGSVPATSPETLAMGDTTKRGAAAKPGYWQSASAVKKATVILMPFALAMSWFMLAPEEEASVSVIKAKRKPPKAHADAGLALTGAASDGGALPATSGALAGGTAPVDLDAGAAGGEVASGSDVPARPFPLGSDNASAPVADAEPPKLAPLAKGTKTLERQALDSVAAGSFEEAASLYNDLAANHPDDPTYREAARILREKTGHVH